MLFSFVGEGIDSTTVKEISKGGTINIDGSATDKFIPNNIGSGTIFVDGISTTHYTPDVKGTGGLWSWAGAAESISISPAGLYTLLKIQGTSPSSRSVIYTGSGSLKKFQGAAESLTFNPEEKQMLFSFVGEGTQARTSKLLSQGGVLTVRGTSGDPLLTFAEQPRVEIDITGDSIDLRTHSYHGSGRITNVHSADEAFVRDDYKGSGSIGTLRGIAFVQVVVWQPPHTQVWII